MSLLSLPILKLRLETDREIDFMFKFNADMRVVADTQNAKYGTSARNIFVSLVIITLYF